MASHNQTSHAEMWDDSLLVDSWNDALQEYKHYHSIHAKGEKVEDVLKMAEDESNGIGVSVDYEGDVYVEDSNADMNLEEEDLTGASSENKQPAAKIEKPVSSQASEGPQSKGLALPQHLIGQVHDESLKNLLMSWYYAGYYTGLHEGQQKGVASKNA